MSTSLRITVEQFQEMTDRGEFDPVEDHQVELIRGEIIPRFGDDSRTPMNSPHLKTLWKLCDWSYEVAPGPMVQVSVQGSLCLADADSQPQPDLAWLVREQDTGQLPTAEDVLLLIEVSDTSLTKDRGPKLELYAEAGIRDYWVVDVQDRIVLAHRDPQGTTYRDVTRYAIGQEIHPLAFPDVALPVSRIFPD